MSDQHELNALDQYFHQLEEPQQSMMLYLRRFVLNLSSEMTEHWKYMGPFYYYKGKMFAYLWIDKKTKNPYMGIARSTDIDHPKLVLGDRKRIKIFPFEVADDIPVDELNEVLQLAMKLY